MKRNWNWSLWIGFLFALAGFLTYPFFTQFPATRDFPWANFLLFGVGGVLLLTGLVRAFGKPKLYRGKIFGSILATLSFLGFCLFAYLIFFELRQVPASTGAPRVGQKAPEFTLMDQNNKPVALVDLLSGSKGAILIFYRGFWWPLCNSELRSFQQKLSEFDARGLRVVGISVDTPEINQRQCRKLGYTFPLLSDPKAEVIRRYGVLHPGAGPKRQDIARPAEFLVDSTGTVRWVNLTENIAVRARPKEVLSAFEQSRND